MTVGKIVFNDQIFAFLRVDEGCGVGMTGGYDGRHVRKTVFRQRFFHHGVRAGGDLVDHRPGEGDQTAVAHVIRKALVCTAVFDPAVRHGEHGVPQLVAVMGTVVHADHGQREPSRQITGVKQGGDLAHVADGVGGPGDHVAGHVGQACAVGARQVVALFRNGEGSHLQPGVLESTGQRCPVLMKGGIRPQRGGDGADDRFFKRAVRFQRDQHVQVVMRVKNALGQFRVIALSGDQTGVCRTLIQQGLGAVRLKRAEDVARAKMNPPGRLHCFFRHGGTVKAGQTVGVIRPPGGVFQAFII